MRKVDSCHRHACIDQFYNLLNFACGRPQRACYLGFALAQIDLSEYLVSAVTCIVFVIVIAHLTRTALTIVQVAATVLSIVLKRLLVNQLLAIHLFWFAVNNTRVFLAD